MIRRIVVFFWLGLFTLVHPVVAGEKVYIPYFKTIGIPAVSGQSAAQMFSDFVEQYSEFDAELEVRRDSNTRTLSINEIRENAEVTSSKFYAMGVINKLEGVYAITVSMYATSTNQKLWTEFKTTNDPNDLQGILRYLAVHLGKDDESMPGDLYSLTSLEAEKSRRKRANTAFGAGVSGLFNGLETIDQEFATGLGLVGSFDARDFIYELNANYLHEPSNTYVHGGINVLYPFGERKSAFFTCLGTDFMYHESMGEHHSGKDFYNGLMLTGGGGYLWKRYANTSLHVYLRGYVGSYNIEHVTPYGALFSMALLLGS